MTEQSLADSKDEPATTGGAGVASPALFTSDDAVRVLRLSRSVIYEQIKARRLRTVRQGRATRIPASAIAEYIRLLESETETLWNV
jgi:excisionase family DNA binding protein